MGTRNLTCVYYNNDYRLAQYCQWDGYPNGQGITALKFVRDIMQPEVFKKNLLALNEANQTYIENLYKKIGVNEQWASLENDDKFQQLAPHLHRNMGTQVLQFVQDEPEGLYIKKFLEFAADSLFCEWAYVIDLDHNTFEVYQGFNKKPLKKHERFFYLQQEKYEESYYPVKLVKYWEINALPTNEEFLESFKKDDDN